VYDSLGDTLVVEAHYLQTGVSMRLDIASIFE
jgi:hypothetical protein